MSQKHDERTPVVVPLLGFSFLVFLLGTAVVHFRLFPYPQFLGPAYTAFEAYRQRSRLMVADPAQLLGEIHYRRARTPERGVTRHVPGKSADGYTLYTSSHRSAAFLVDETGETVHTWELPFYEAWPEPDHLDHPVEESAIFWSNAVLLPGGELLARYGARGTTPYGYGLVKLDRDSNLVWRYSGTAHHHVELDDDGTILTLVHDFRRIEEDGPLADLPLVRRILDDAIIRLSPDGEVLDSINLMEAFARSDFRWVLESNFLAEDGISGWDVLHTNGVRPLPTEFARHHGFAEEGALLVSMRSPSLLAIVDPGADSVTWMGRGFWKHQHDPHPMDNGHIMLFDNLGYARARRGRSRIIEWDPATGAVVWSYTGTVDDPFYSEFSSHLQILPNGNVLVTESNAGRIFEVTRDGEIVWEFWNPARLTEDGLEYVASVADAKRIPPGAVDFLER